MFTWLQVMRNSFWSISPKRTFKPQGDLHLWFMQCEIKLIRIIKVNNYWACTLLMLRKQRITQPLLCINSTCVNQKTYDLHMSNSVSLWFRKLPQWNCNVKRTNFQSGLSFKSVWATDLTKLLKTVKWLC